MKRSRPLVALEGSRPRSLAWLVVALAGVLLGGCRAEILRDQPEDSANEVLTALQQNGIAAERQQLDEEENTWAVEVPSSDRARALALLSRLKLPRKSLPRFEDCMKQGPLIPSPTSEKVCYMQSLQNELTASLLAVPGVIDARVHLALPEKDKIMGTRRGETTATVILEYQSVAGELPLRREEVQAIVAHGVEDLSKSNVSVTLKASTLAAAVPGESGNALDLVDFAGVLVERGSVNQLKLLMVLSCMVLGLLGVLLFLGGRANDHLRLQVEGLERQLKSRQLVAAQKAE